MMQQFHTQEYPTANRNYKDRLFRFVFNNKKDLLDLYNACLLYTSRSLNKEVEY